MQGNKRMICFHFIQLKEFSDFQNTETESWTYLPMYELGIKRCFSVTNYQKSTLMSYKILETPRNETNFYLHSDNIKIKLKNNILTFTMTESVKSLGHSGTSKGQRELISDPEIMGYMFGGITVSIAHAQLHENHHRFSQSPSAFKWNDWL